MVPTAPSRWASAPPPVRQDSAPECAGLARRLTSPGCCVVVLLRPAHQLLPRLLRHNRPGPVHPDVVEAAERGVVRRRVDQRAIARTVMALPDLFDADDHRCGGCWSGTAPVLRQPPACGWSRRRRRAPGRPSRRGEGGHQTQPLVAHRCRRNRASRRWGREKTGPGTNVLDCAGRAPASRARQRAVTPAVAEVDGAGRRSELRLAAA